MLTLEQLKAIIPSTKLDYTNLIIALNDGMNEFSINTRFRVCSFLAQILHETGGLKWMRELGGDSYFKKYDGRKDLGNTQPGDGVRYKGRGFFQLTGRANYKRYGEKLGLDLLTHPELAEAYPAAARIAGQYWVDHGLNTLADTEEITRITKKINGGVNGLADRKVWYAKCKTAITMYEG